MKKFTLLLLVLFASMMAGQKGEVVLFEEGWESYPENVAALPDGDQNWKMVIHPNGRPFSIWGISNSGTRSVSHTTSGVTSGKPRDWLICRKALTIPSYGGKLSFWVQAARPQNYEVRISQTTISDTTKFTDCIFNSATTTTVFEEKSFDLKAYAGKTIYVAWKRKGPYGMTYGSNWILDDIKVFGYTQDQEAPVCQFVTGSQGFTDHPLSLAVKVKDQTSVDSVYALTMFNNVLSAPIPMQKNSADTSIFNLEIPANANYSSGAVRFITKDKLGNRDYSTDFLISWGDILLDENFEGDFPPAGWKNDSWKLSPQFGANNSQCAYSSFLSDGTLATFPIKITADAALSFYVANRYMSVPGGGKIVGQDSIFCEASTDNGTNWQAIAIHSPETPDQQHYKYEINLFPLVGETVTLRWRHSVNGTMDAEGALIDSILVFAKSASINNNPAVVSAASITGSYPNPFNNSTVVNYQLSKQSDIQLSVYNAKGEFIRDLFRGKLEAGNHQARFDANNLNSGVYFYRLTSQGVVQTRKVLLVK